ncbi:MAG: PilN domain-containing protein [Deltaproteobacteria bacterium]|nr:PilN domain-containing protein [Deltaproteobacteria bacterium]
MIRINLLPISDAERVEDGKQLFVLLFFVAVLSSGLMFYVKGQVQGELDAQLQALSGLQRGQRELDEKIQESQALERTFNELKVEVDRQQLVIDDLTQGQVSPAALLVELSYLLSPPKDDAERENFDQKGWRWSWDTGGVWLERFREEDRLLKLQGHARGLEDVGELLNRLNASSHFLSTHLKYTEATRLTFPNGRAGSFVRFEIDARVLYGASDLKRLFELAGEPLPGAPTSGAR